ncbi:PQQ-binding-like beta-propeller repeat protein [Nocardioides sp. CCNWLW239]|uniref:outer membrane protein assembly factor BamB family protein n=1 Tax=Nocardioides sp. CCNWLW239 TaxID=3128902 RepID=UPI003017C157
MSSRGGEFVWRHAVAAVVLALVGAGLCGCGVSRNPYAEVPRLKVAWIAPVEGSPLLTERWATEDLWISFDSRSSRLVALNLEDGSTAWTLASRKLCGLSDVNADGLLAVRSGAVPDCDEVRVIDTATGEELWSTEVGDDENNPVTAGQIGLSGQTVSAAGVCGVDRWEVGSGRKLASLTGTRRHPDLPGRCRAALTSSDLAVIVDSNALVGYDVDTGKRRWSAKGKDADIASLHATDQVLAEIQLDGVSGLRTIDPASGEIGPIIGRPRGRYLSPHPVEVVGNRVVGSYDRSSRPSPSGTYESAVRVWDPESGKELGSWPGKEGDDYLGASEDGVYMGREVPDGRSEHGTAYWVTRADWTGGPARTVGWIEDDAIGSGSVVGDLVIEAGFGELEDGSYGHRVVAYTLPTRTTADPIPRSKNVERPSWASGDVRPDPQVDPCAEVREETLRGLGFTATLEREVPLDCEWAEGSVTLSTHAEVMRPDSTASATARAREWVSSARDPTTSSVAVDGLGDEAWASVSTLVAKGPTAHFELGDPRMSRTEIIVAVRQRNVVALVRLTDIGDHREGRLPPGSVARETGAMAALKDILGAAGAEVKVPDAVSDGPVTDVPDMCAAVADDVRDLLPGAKPTDLTSPGDARLRGCLWATREAGYIHSHVQVVAYAVGPSPITGATGSVAAEEVFADSRGELATPRRDQKWDESVMAEGSDGYVDASHLRVRRDNVILVVDIGLRDRDKPSASKVAPRVADRAMKAILR